MIRDNPINFSCSSSLLRSYLIVCLPRLKTFNEETILTVDRQTAEATCRHLVRFRSLRKTTIGNSVGSAGIDLYDSPSMVSVDDHSRLVQQQKLLYNEFSRDFDQVMKTLILETINKLH